MDFQQPASIEPGQIGKNDERKKIFFLPQKSTIKIYIQV